MSKRKSQPSSKKSKRAATDVNPETGQPLLIPEPRDLKHHLAMIQIAKAKADKANKELTQAYKIADQAGINGKAIRTGLALAKKDPLSAKAEMVQLSLVLQELGAGVQINVHEPKYEDAVAEAKVKGFNDGKAGRDKDAGSWVKGSPAARQYEESYAEGQLENMPIDSTAKAAIKDKGKLALAD